MGTTTLHPPVRVSQDPDIYSDHPGTVHMDGRKHTASPCQSIPRSRDTLTILEPYMHGWTHCTPLLEYPEIPRYSDHPGTVHGWTHAHCTPLSEYPKILKYTLTIPRQYLDRHMHTAPPCQSIPRSRSLTSC